MWHRVRLFLRQLRRRSVVFVIRMWKRHVRTTVSHSLPIPCIAVHFLPSSASTAARCEFVASLVRHFEEMGYSPHIWVKTPNSRQTRLFHKASSKEDLSEEIFLLSQRAPLWACRLPENAAAAAANAGASVLLLIDPGDDVATRCQFVMAVAEKDFRPEKVSKSTLRLLTHSDALVLLGFSPDQVRFIRQTYPATYIASWKLKNALNNNEKVIGFTWIRDAGAFYHALLEHPLNIEGFVPLSNRRRFKEKPLQTLSQTAAHHQARLVTTDKDALFLSAKMRHHVTVLPLTLHLEDAFLAALQKSWEEFLSLAPTSVAVKTAS